MTSETSTCATCGINKRDALVLTALPNGTLICDDCVANAVDHAASLGKAGCESSVRTMIVWASGLIEFLPDREEPDGSILVCTAHGAEAIAGLLSVVRELTTLHDFGDRVGLRVPEIDPTRGLIEVGHDAAVEALIDWEENVRDHLEDDLAIDWVRA